jgi:hypothetical protein
MALSLKTKVTRRLVQYRYGKGHKPNDDEEQLAEAIAEAIINEVRDIYEPTVVNQVVTQPPVVKRGEIEEDVG